MIKATVSRLTRC